MCAVVHFVIDGFSFRGRSNISSNGKGGLQSIILGNHERTFSMRGYLPNMRHVKRKRMIVNVQVQVHRQRNHHNQNDRKD
uniref:Chromo domain-containing protein n=1 Tax=Parascaris univalens TaxID=6257 RepID=A0A915AXW2_PARUN